MDFLCLDFINSRWYTAHKPFCDPMDDPDWLAKISETYHLHEITSLDSMHELKIFREFLFHTLRKLCATQRLEPASIEKINQVLAKIRVQKELASTESGYELKIRHHSDDASWVMYEIALSFSELIAGYPLAYLKKCENPECDWIFYDDSKSHRRKWCDNRCASLMKVRKYRAAKKDANAK